MLSPMDAVQGVGEAPRRKQLPGRTRQFLTDGYLFEPGFEELIGVWHGGQGRGYMPGLGNSMNHIGESAVMVSLRRG